MAEIFISYKSERQSEYPSDRRVAARVESDSAMHISLAGFRVARTL
jgi:hypothetical protein